MKAEDVLVPTLRSAPDVEMLACVRYLDTTRTLAVDAETARLRVAVSVAGVPNATATAVGRTVVVAETWRPLWTFLVAILLFPVGLLALLVRRSAVLTVEVTPAPDGCEVVISGRGHETVCDAVLSGLSATPRVAADV